MNAIPSPVRAAPGTPIAVRWLHARELSALYALRVRDARGAHGATTNVQYFCRDALDPFAHHLGAFARDGALLGAVRALAPDQALCAGGGFAEALFDLGAWREAPAALELSWPLLAEGAPARAVAELLLAGARRHAAQRRVRHLLMCAPLAPQALGALRARRADWVPPLLRMRPWSRPPRLRAVGEVGVPAWIERLLAAGARVCGEPTWDPALRRAVVPLWLEDADGVPA